MNPALDRQLARLRTRLAKTPLPGFFTWWGRELLACLPERWRKVLAERSETLLLDQRDGETVVWREHRDDIREYARIQRDLPAEAQAAEFHRLREAIGDPMVRTVFCIPGERVLSRTLVLPAAAEDNLRQVLQFEMDRQTPFKADQVYFDSRVVGRDAAGRNIRVELVLIPRTQLDEELSVAPAGSELDGVDTWRGQPGQGRRGANLLPYERRAKRRNLRLPLNLGLAALALVLLVVCMDESLANRAAAVESMQAEVEKASEQARQVAELRKTLADSISGANFLADRKRKAPLAVAIINDLTERMPEDTYLERLQIENKRVELQGQGSEAARLISLLSSSPCLGNPGFQGQVQPDARTGKERFQISAELKECDPSMIASAAAAPAPKPEPAEPAKAAPADAKEASGAAPPRTEAAAQGKAVQGGKSATPPASSADPRMTAPSRRPLQPVKETPEARHERVEKAQAEVRDAQATAEKEGSRGR